MVITRCATVGVVGNPAVILMNEGLGTFSALVHVLRFHGTLEAPVETPDMAGNAATLTPDGDVIIVGVRRAETEDEWPLIRRLRTDGTIVWEYWPDAASDPEPLDVDVAPDGSVYVMLPEAVMRMVP